MVIEIPLNLLKLKCKINKNKLYNFFKLNY